MLIAYLWAETGGAKLLLCSNECVEGVDGGQHTLADVIPVINEYQKGVYSN